MKPKLSDGDIIAVRKLSANGMSQRKIASMFGVTQRAICVILSGRRKTLAESGRHASREDAFWSLVDRRGDGECWLWTGMTTKSGHGVFHGRGVSSAHRFSAILAGMDISGMVVRHACDNPACVNPGHLQVGTHADNVADCVQRNRNAVGERNGRARLSVEQVKTVLKAKSSSSELARVFNVDPKTISNVRLGKSWKCVVNDRSS